MRKHSGAVVLRQIAFIASIGVGTTKPPGIYLRFQERRGVFRAHREQMPIPVGLLSEYFQRVLRLPISGALGSIFVRPRCYPTSG